eukprot:scaffold5199_cov199-Alexandrium_tamarense.AAC.15
MCGGANRIGLLAGGWTEKDRRVQCPRKRDTNNGHKYCTREPSKLLQNSIASSLQLHCKLHLCRSSGGIIFIVAMPTFLKELQS